MQIYIGGRPFVVRDAERPTDGFSLLDKAEKLEQAEQRLKADILKEARQYGGIILIHEEITDTSGSTSIAPAWLAADFVQTPLELFQSKLVAPTLTDLIRSQW